MNNTFFTLTKHTAVTLVLMLLIMAPFQPLVVHAQPAPTTPPSPAASASYECNWLSNWSLCITNVVYAFTVGIGSGFAYISAYFFDWSIALSLNGSAYALDFVSQGWTTARDIANMAFLFILLYIAFIIIFEADTNDTVHMLTWVIIIALLVNFSFFFTRLVIDAGNILAIQFYNAIPAPSVSSTAQGTGIQSTVASIAAKTGSFSDSKDLTAAIMGMLNMQNLFGTDSFQYWYKPTVGAAPGFWTVLISLSFLYIAAGIMLWLLTVAFITNGVKFLFRIVILWFLIIASPLAFIAKAIPKFEGYYKQWQDALIAHAFYPVAFMFIFLILTNFAVQMGQDNNLIKGLFNGLSGATASNPVAAIGYAAANVGIRLGFVIAMLYVGMEASKKVGVMGASAAEHAGNWVGGKLKGTMVAGAKYGPGWAAGAAYRNLGGAGANYIDKKLQGSRWANQTGTLGGILGYRLRKNVLAPMKETSLGTVASTYKERQEFLKGRKTEMQSNLRDSENKATLERVASNPAAASDADKDRLKSMGKRELETLKAGDLQKIAAVLSEDQIKKIADIEKLTDDEKEKVRVEWEQKSLSAPLQKSNKIIAEELRKIRDELSAGGITMPTTSTHLAVGAPLTEANIKAATVEVKDRLAQERTRANDRSLTFAERKQAQGNVINLQEMQTQFKELNEQRGKVRPNIDGANKQGEFTVK